MCTFNGAGAIIYDSINSKILVVKGRDKFSLPKGLSLIVSRIHE